jgi:arsenite methyltransferase
MVIACPVGLNPATLRSEISSLYGRVAALPGGDFHFHRGPAYAAEFLGYEAEELAGLPSESTASFAGVGNPFAIGTLGDGETVVDIGCGAGMDLLLAARRVGSRGKAIGIDMTDAMLEKTRNAAAAGGMRQAEVRKGDFTSLPIESSSVDVVISNGVLNLVPEKDFAFAEIARILRPGGRLQLADIAVDHGLSDEIRRNVDLWTGWIAGALPEAEILAALTSYGLAEGSIVARFDCFRGTSKEKTARQFGVHGVNVFARKPMS